MIGDTVESDFTYEDLRAIVRRERSSGALSEVRLDLYPCMMHLLDKQSRECERQIGIDIGSLASAAANERRKNIQQSIKLVVEHRMSKVASLAIRTAMGCVNSVDNLPMEERQYYESVLSASQVHWLNTERRKKNVVLMDLESVSKPAPVSVKADVPEVVSVGVTEDVSTLKDMPIIPDDVEELDMGDLEFPDDFPEFPDSEVPPDIDVPLPVADAPATVSTNDVAVPETAVVVEAVSEVIDTDDIYEPDPEEAPKCEVENIPAPSAPVKEEEYDDNSLLTIHVVEDIPEFVGPTRDYLLRKGDVVRMPAGMASVLINRKMATKIL